MSSLGICQVVWNRGAQSARSLHRTIQTDTHACPKPDFNHRSWCVEDVGMFVL